MDLFLSPADPFIVCFIWFTCCLCAGSGKNHLILHKKREMYTLSLFFFYNFIIYSDAIHSVVFIPSMAAEVIPPAYPAPSPQGINARNVGKAFLVSHQPDR